MKRLLDAFTDHPRAMGDTYGGRAARALRFGCAMIAAGAACLVHAAIPSLFKTTASRTIKSLRDELTVLEQRSLTATPSMPDRTHQRAQG